MHKSCSVLSEKKSSFKITVYIKQKVFVCIRDAQYINLNIVYQPILEILEMYFYTVHYNVVMYLLIVFIYCFNKIVNSFNIV